MSQKESSQRLEGLPWAGFEAPGELDPQLLEDPQWVYSRCIGTVPAWAPAVRGQVPSQRHDACAGDGRVRTQCALMASARDLRGHASSLSPFSHQRRDSPAPGDLIMFCESEQSAFSPKALLEVAPALPPLPTCSCHPACHCEALQPES